ncbi:hypothetical protein [Dickeya oryzae]|nr:hypothetical protein [Dickeya oryzae]
MAVQTSDWGPVVDTGQGRMAMHWVLQLPGALDLERPVDGVHERLCA